MIILTFRLVATGPINYRRLIYMWFPIVTARISMNTTSMIQTYVRVSVMVVRDSVLVIPVDRWLLMACRSVLFHGQ